MAALLAIVPTHQDAALEWTVAAAVLTGSAVAVATVGVPIAIWQLLMVQKDQERLAAQLAAQPQIEIGLRLLGDSEAATEQTLRIPWPNPDFTSIAQVEVVVANVGARSARNPRWTVTFPTDTKNLQPTGKDERRDDGPLRQIAAFNAILNPGARRVIGALFEVSNQTPNRIPIVCRCAIEDAQPLSTTLYLDIERVPTQ